MSSSWTKQTNQPTPGSRRFGIPGRLRGQNLITKAGGFRNVQYQLHKCSWRASFQRKWHGLRPGNKIPTLSQVPGRLPAGRWETEAIELGEASHPHGVSSRGAHRAPGMVLTAAPLLRDTLLVPPRHGLVLKHWHFSMICDKYSKPITEQQGQADASLPHVPITSRKSFQGERASEGERVRGHPLQSSILQVSCRGAHANGPSLDTKHINNALLVIYKLNDNTFAVQTK